MTTNRKRNVPWWWVIETQNFFAQSWLKALYTKASRPISAGELKHLCERDCEHYVSAEAIATQARLLGFRVEPSTDRDPWNMRVFVRRVPKARPRRG